jgi:sugar transferase (PEP-CTERM system associated)
MIRVFNQYVAIKSVLLVIVESLIVALSLIGAVGLRFWGNHGLYESVVQVPLFPIKALIIVITLQLCFYYNDLYDFHMLRGRQDQLVSLGQSVGQACVLLGVLYFAVPDLIIGRGVFLISIALGATLIAAVRLAFEGKWYTGALKQKVLILGTGELADTVARHFTSRPDLNLSIVGFLKSGDDAVVSLTAEQKVLGKLQDLVDVVRATRAEKVIVALKERRLTLPVRELVRLRMEGIVVEDAQSTLSALSGRVCLDTLQPSWFVFSEGFRRSKVLLAVKRQVDIVCASLGMVLSLPVMLLVALAIRLDSRGPVIYRQRRVGLGGQCFNVLKFRSMAQDAEKAGAQWACAGDQRVTRVGAFIRKYRLDEFPQFINVIRGDMSFVGPRPERPEFVENLRDVIPFYDERHTVRPGITGWAQVQYVYGASVEDARRKLEYDLFYLKNMSIMFDIAIIFHTVRTIMSGQGGR